MGEVIKRYPVGLDDEQLSQIETLKQEQFYNKSYSDLLRYVIDRGLKAIENQKEGDK